MFIRLLARKRHMGTNLDTQELKAKIKYICDSLGWSQNKLARTLYTELNDFDDEVEIFRFQERLKKELQRETTKKEKLQTYLDILITHTDAQKLDVVCNKCIPLGSISEHLLNEMKLISKDITKILKSSPK